MRNIYGIGETVLDIIFRHDQPQRAVPGGSTFNTIISLGRCGLYPTMATQTGDDHVGDIIARFLQENGVRTEFLTACSHCKTPVSLAFLDERDDAHYQFYKNSNLTPPTDRFPSFSADDVVIFGSFYAVNPALRPYTREFLRRAHEVGAILYYDVNFRPAHRDDLPAVIPAIEENMRMATIVRLSHEDILCVYGDDYDAALSHVSSLCSHLIVTHGAEGVDHFAPNLTLHYSTPSIKTISTIGAGDSFNAGVVFSVVMEDWTKKQVETATAAMIATMDDRAQRFAANVCASFENYVSREFALNMTERYR